MKNEIGSLLALNTQANESINEMRKRYFNQKEISNEAVAELTSQLNKLKAKN